MGMVTTARSMMRSAEPVIDRLVAPGAYLAGKFLGALKNRMPRFPASKAALIKSRVWPIQDHYYEPMFNPVHLTKPLDADRDLPGIRWNVEGQLQLLQEMRYGAELELFKEEDRHGEGRFFFRNDMFEWCDADYWYSIVRHFKPSKIMEIGSGYSTLMAQAAIAKNAKEHAAYACDHLCIEPYEAPWLERAGVTRVLRQKVQDVDLGVFLTLKRNDILFIDSSHVIRPQGDVLTEFLQLLPRLQPGVIVHVHDIFSPRDYPREWIVDNTRLWNEQYLLEAFLSENDRWQILGATNYLFHHHYEELRATCPHTKSPTKPRWEPSSFYIQHL